MSKIVFIHIPKTAGTSFRHLLDARYPDSALLPLYEAYPYKPEVLARLREKVADARAVIGHVPFGIDDQLGFEGRYVTFLRQPVQRLLSYYRHNQREPSARFHQQIKDGMTLADILRSGIDPEFNNNMTRMVSGIGDNSLLLDQAVLDQALENIERRFLYVGLTEHFDQSVNQLGACLDWRGATLFKSPALNRAPDRQSLSLDEETLDLIRHYNSLDLALYEHVQRQFEFLPPKSLLHRLRSLFR